MVGQSWGPLINLLIQIEISFGMIEKREKSQRFFLMKLLHWFQTHLRQLWFRSFEHFFVISNLHSCDWAKVEWMLEACGYKKITLKKSKFVIFRFHTVAAIAEIQFLPCWVYMLLEFLEKMVGQSWGPLVNLLIQIETSFGMIEERAN
jgi:hypothetical protein